MRAPDLQQGTVVQAWRSAAGPARPDQRACLRTWFVRGPFHPAWRMWIVSVIHLREIPGVKTPVRLYREAEYEIIIAAVDPAHEPDDPDRPVFQIMAPLDLVEQFHGVTDDEAARICDEAVRQIVALRISPDQDYQRLWRRWVADAARHHREGHDRRN